MAEPLALKDHTYEARIFFDRVVKGFGILIVLTLFLVARLVNLQIVQHDLYRTLAEENRIHVQSLPPTRGLVLDRNGVLLADNSPTYDLTIIKERVEDLGATFAAIRNIVDLSDAEISDFEKRLKRRRRPFESVAVKFKLSETEIARIAVNRFAIPGVEVEARLVRHYPFGPLTAHAVGSVRRITEEDLRTLDPIEYAGTSHIGKTGIERFYERNLLGSVGYQKVETNARGRVMKTLGGSPPNPGRNLILHLDVNLQRVATEAFDGRRGALVALEPATGGVLAMVSLPAFDPNPFVTGIDRESFARLRDSIDVPLFNRAIQGQYEPGSTLKPFLGFAGLNSGVTSPGFTIDDPGWFSLPDDPRVYRDWNWRLTDSGGHGVVNLEKAIYRSCNIYFYDLAVKMGIDRIHDQLAMFGLGQDTTYDIPDARAGLLPSREWKLKARGEPWYTGDTVNIGIGQGDLLITPLQLATAVAVLANRGRWVQPRILKESQSSGLPRSRNRLPHNVRAADPRTWEVIIEAMAKVVHRGNQAFGENGTAWAYIGRDIEYRMAGKSGTAQVVGIEQGEEYDEELLDERLRKHAWFIAFAPVDDPQIALAVLVENGGGGSEVAAPIARRVIDEYLLHGAGETRRMARR